MLGLMLALGSHAATHQNASLRVGVYQNEPGVFIDGQSRVSGFYIDILEYVAGQEGWQLDYVQSDWAGLMDGLANGEIDLVAGMAHTPERDRVYDFTREPMFVNWGQIYTTDGGIQSLLDLNGRTVVGLEADVYALSFRSLLKRFDLAVDFRFVNSYQQVLAEVDAGRADAGITSRSNGDRLAPQFDVRRSPIVCCSQEIGYAVRDGEFGHELATLDRYLVALKSDKASYYFQALDQWYGIDPRHPLPEWVSGLIALLAGGAALLFCGVVLLNRKVRERTRRLQEAHDLLDERVRRRTEELYKANKQLRDEIDDHRKTQNKLKHMATHDALTGLPNRRWFSERLQENVKRARRAERKLAVLFLDLDGFKAVNDTYGHDLGDQLLVDAAARLSGSLREVDQIARLGGDEFIIMLPEVSGREGALAVARKVADLFQAPFTIDSLSLKVGVSIGISCYPDHGEDGETLLRNADLAMYEAKHRLQGDYCEYHPALALNPPEEALG